MDYIVKEVIKYPSNTHKADIAAFAQPYEAVKFAKDKAKERDKYDHSTPFCYAVYHKGEAMNLYFNNEILE